MSGQAGPCRAPVVTLTHSAAGKPVLRWEHVEGAGRYYIYRSTQPDGIFTPLARTSRTRYTNFSAAHGVTYYYMVRAVRLDGAGAPIRSSRSPCSAPRGITCDESLPAAARSTAAFTGRMNRTAAALGMTNSVFRDSVGIDNRSTARDLLKLMAYAHQTGALTGIWDAPERTLDVGGPNPRQQTVDSTVFAGDLQEHYPILGGKTGTLSVLGAWNLAVILGIPGSEDRLAVVVLYANENDSGKETRYLAARQAADAALTKYHDPAADPADVCCRSAAVCLIPADGSEAVLLYEKNAGEVLSPASITKVLTALCLLDAVEDLSGTLTFSYSDTLVKYYAGDFHPGDCLSLEQAVSAMLLPSSNVTAAAVARTVGEMILK